MYALYERKIHAIVEDWNRYYAPHRAKNRTDITDVFDSLFICVKMFRFRTSLLMTPSGK